MSVYDELKKEIAGLEKKKGVLIDYKSSIQIEIQELKKEEQSLNGQIKQIETDFENRKKAAVGKKSKAEDDLTAIMSEIGSKKKELSDLKEKLEVVAFDIFKKEEESSGKLAELKAKISSLSGSIESLNGEKALAERGLDEALKKLVPERQAIASIEATKKDLEDACASLKGNISALENRILNITEDSESRRVALNQASDKVIAENEKLKGVKAEVALALKALDEVAKEKESVAEEIKRVYLQDEDNKKRSAELSRWENKLKVEDKAQANKNAYLNKRERILGEAEKKIAEKEGI
jgi:chromosome segregation ATPase